MKIQLIRNATMKISYADRMFLTDPMLAPRNTFNPFVGIARNPLTELPFPAEEVIAEIDGVVLSHGHRDHFDEAASALLPKEIPFFCQPGDEVRISKEGFQTVFPLETHHKWAGITITRTGGLHGTGKMSERFGMVSGFVFQADNEPTVYWAGDSIWCEPVENAIEEFKPDIIITHSGGARFPDSGFIIMDGEQTLSLAKAAPDAVVVAVHMEALDHCTVTREALRAMADKEDIPPSRLIIPADGETVHF